MATKKTATISWSGGKDSALALYKILQANEVDVASLHCVINQETKRVGMHGVREALIERQAEAIGIPLIKLYLESSESHAAYESLMLQFYRACEEAGIHGVVFGDIFLEDLKLFRENLLSQSGLHGIFPLWKLPTRSLIKEFVGIGFKTVICAASATYFSASQTGKTIDDDFLRELSQEVDPCGENGEFHTFVYDGPIFKSPVKFETGGIIKKVYTFQRKDEDIIQPVESAFWFQDLLPLITR